MRHSLSEAAIVLYFGLSEGNSPSHWNRLRIVNIGIISDTHGNASRLHRAIGRLTDRGIAALVHCGDIGSRECFNLLAGAGVAAYLVAGNMDRAMGDLSTAARQTGVTFAADFVGIPIGNGEHLAATHGHLLHLLSELIDGGQFAYVAHGHSHRRRDDRVGRVRVVNPGALHRPRGGEQPGCAWLDTTTDELQFLPIS
jgi:hypothetical protein